MGSITGVSRGKKGLGGWFRGSPAGGFGGPWRGLGGGGGVPAKGFWGKGPVGLGVFQRGSGGPLEGGLGVFWGLRASPHVKVIDQGLGEAGGGRDRLPAPPLCGGRTRP